MEFDDRLPLTSLTGDNKVNARESTDNAHDKVDDVDHDIDGYMKDKNRPAQANYVNQIDIMVVP